MHPQKTPRDTNMLCSGFRNEAELDELPSLVTSARSPCTQPAAVAAPAPAPEPVPKSRNDIFTAYLQFERDLRRLLSDLGPLQKLVFSEDWPSIVDHPSTQRIYRLAQQAITNLIQIARKRFAPAGVVLDII